ncbi:unnamed protein product [Ilex paraguariensis]|uniref:RING-type E3 ubiquitin transferase n=1 Tax=Ilex paraguariensis TaxID=185542 RepID=A0ABC8TUE0_9AQUA
MFSPSTTTDITTLLLDRTDDDDRRESLRRQTLREASRLLRRVSSRRLMREPSIVVRETAAEQLEARQTDWAYSKPVVILDVVWNLVFIVVATAVLILSKNEMPMVPLRLWILGYILQCVLHEVCVWMEFRRRRRWREGEGIGSSGGYVTLAQLTEAGTSTVANRLEFSNTVFSFIWWLLGFYWVSAAGPALAQYSPHLYWLCLILLAFDVAFIFFCVALACVIGMAVCCCLPCIIAILYAMGGQDGATKKDIEQLSKYKFQRINDVDKLNGEIQGPCGGVMTECGTNTPTEHVISLEDAVCCPT